MAWADAIVTAALANCDLSYEDPQTQARYVSLLFPNDGHNQASAMARGMSGCALFALSVMRLAGLKHSLLAEPYVRRIGRAVADVIEVSKGFAAWRGLGKSILLPEPTPGCIALIGGPGGGGLEHVLIVTGVTQGIVDSIDGGQGPRSTAIRHRRRRLQARGSELWLTTADGPTTSTGRRVAGFLDPELIEVTEQVKGPAA